MEHFAQLFTKEGFGQAIINSLQTTGVSLVISLLVGICAAYVIARRRFHFGLKKPLTYWVLLVRVLPPVAFTILQKAQFFQSELEKLKIDFNRMSASSASPQKRGYEFEQFLNSLFNLFDLDPKCSYKISGEQIDGAFTHDNQDYLIEAKWEAKAMPKSALHAFSGKVKDKLTTTLGLFISISGFADECIRRENSNIILMDYQDIIMVIENRIDLKQLIYLKRQHASQTGIILYHPAC